MIRSPRMTKENLFGKSGLQHAHLFQHARRAVHGQRTIVQPFNKDVAAQIGQVSEIGKGVQWPRRHALELCSDHAEDGGRAELQRNMPVCEIKKMLSVLITKPFVTSTVQ